MRPSPQVKSLFIATNLHKNFANARNTFAKLAEHRRTINIYALPPDFSVIVMIIVVAVVLVVAVVAAVVSAVCECFQLRLCEPATRRYVKYVAS